MSLLGLGSIAVGAHATLVWAQDRGPDAATATATLSSEAPVVAEISESLNLSDTPRTIADMIELERRIREAVIKAVPATVGVRVGNGQGSGVIVNDQGLVLTAAHVIGRPGLQCNIVLSDGQVLAGRTLGVDRELDAGMVQIDDPRVDESTLPHVDVGRSGTLPVGSWTIATGHPGGYEAGRPPVVRVGRINVNRSDLLQSDNTLVGGDSGGPLFDLDGRVVGIHSRIGDSMSRNVHVSSDVFLETWGPLVDAEDSRSSEEPAWRRRAEAEDGIRLDLGGARGRDRGQALNGRQGDGRVGATVFAILPDSPAEKAGVRIGDRIVGIGVFETSTEAEMAFRRNILRPGVAIIYRIIRDGEEIELEVEPVPAGQLEDPEVQRVRPYAGVMGIDMRGPIAEPSGVAISAVTPDSPAEAAGFEAGDVLMAVNGVVLNDADQLRILLSRARGGDRISCVLRKADGTEQTVDVVLANRFPLYME